MMSPHEPPAFVHTTRVAASGQRVKRKEPLSSELPSLEPADEGLDICDKTHTCKERSGSALPTRLIDVGQYGTDQVRVIIPAEETRLFHGTSVSYTALSYCWGTCQALKSTRSNISSRKQGISLGEMPLTLRDAVHITRKLNIQYLWVDALCILQDCNEDWQQESAKMGDVYGHAFITIFAFGARDSEGGLAHPAAHAYNLGGNGYRFRDKPLNYRAWALQEWHLSPRRILFTSYGTFFDCLQDTRPDYGYSAYSHRLLPAAEQTYQDWNLLVKNYSCPELTNPLDKLPALAGLAQRFQRLSNGRSGRYLAGHWENDLPGSLLWHRDKFPFRLRGPKPARSTVYRAPTWSWASMDGTLGFVLGIHPSCLNPLSQIASLNLHPSVEADAFGSTVRQLRIRSRMKSLSKEVIVSEVAEHVPLATALHSDLEFRSDFFGPVVCYIYGDEKMKTSIDRSKTLEFCAIMKESDRIWNRVWGLLVVEVGHAHFQRIGCGYCTEIWLDDAVERSIDIF